MSDWVGNGAASAGGGGVDPAAARTPLEEARADLAIWKEALRACATGKEYRVGNRSLTRADLKDCRDMVRYYKGEVSRLSAGRRRGARVLRVVPRDY